MPRKIAIRSSFLGNRIYAGTMSTKTPGAMNDSKQDVTDQTISAVFQHLETLYKQSNGEHKGYVFEGRGTMYFKPEIKEESQ